MPKTIYTPRDELVCVKLDIAESMIQQLAISSNVHDIDIAAILDVLKDIRDDCQRMEAKLIQRKIEIEQE
jgi:hypothetical protein